ncbi:hypothetical protein ACB092_02G241300 [Castanea dentata]
MSKTQQGGNFTVEEDCLIVLARLNMSMDVVQGNEQKHKIYWNRVWDYFHKEKTSKFDHSANSFDGCLALIEISNPSGVNEQEKISKAKELYKNVHKTSFQFDHCWNILRHQPNGWNFIQSLK